MSAITMPVLCRRLTMLRPSPLLGFLTSSTVRTSCNSCSSHNISPRSTSRFSASVAAWRRASTAQLWVAFLRSSPFTCAHTRWWFTCSSRHAWTTANLFYTASLTSYSDGYRPNKTLRHTWSLAPEDVTTLLQSSISYTGCQCDSKWNLRSLSWSTTWHLGICQKIISS